MEVLLRDLARRFGVFALREREHRILVETLHAVEIASRLLHGLRRLCDACLDFRRCQPREYGTRGDALARFGSH